MGMWSSENPCPNLEFETLVDRGRNLYTMIYDIYTMIYDI